MPSISVRWMWIFFYLYINLNMSRWLWLERSWGMVLELGVWGYGKVWERYCDSGDSSLVCGEKLCANYRMGSPKLYMKCTPLFTFLHLFCVFAHTWHTQLCHALFFLFFSFFFLRMKSVTLTHMKQLTTFGSHYWTRKVYIYIYIYIFNNWIFEKDEIFKSWYNYWTKL